MASLPAQNDSSRRLTKNLGDTQETIDWIYQFREKQWIGLSTADGRGRGFGARVTPGLLAVIKRKEIYRTLPRWTVIPPAICNIRVWERRGGSKRSRHGRDSSRQLPRTYWGQTTPWNNLERWEEARSHAKCTTYHAQRRDGFQLGWAIMGSTSSPDPYRKPEAWQFIYHGKPGERPHANIYIIPYNISESKRRATREPAVSLVIRSLLNVPPPSISTIGRRRRLLASWSREEMKEGSELWLITEKIGDSAGRRRLPAVELTRPSK